ncbi:MAG: DUF368 domain-containing protein [Oceanobacter sp.]
MQYVWLFLKGLAMGTADVVPGVSGGTIAFITGIYDKLLSSLGRVNIQALLMLRKEGLAATWSYINGTFLIVLLSGILLAFLSLAKVVHFLMLNHPIWLWSFFFGLIIASVFHVGKEISQWKPGAVILLIVGAVIAAWVSVAAPTSVEPNSLIVFAAGSIAICAMILPGISGSFILLLMGLYEPIMGAIKELDIGIMGLFGCGAVLGLMLFSRFLSWLLAHYRDLTLAVLTGFMVGSLAKVWPWKDTLTTRLNSHGEVVPVYQVNVLPEIGTELGLSLLLMVLGAVLVLGLEKVAGKSE